MTRPATLEDKNSFIAQHFQHELELFLTAVEMWRFSKESDLGLLVAIPRDSAVIHFRNLIKFFISKKSENDFSIGLLTENTDLYFSDYLKWVGKIDESILHISPKRHNPKDLPEGDINDLIIEFKDEVLRLCEIFIADSNMISYRESMEEAVAKSKILSAEHIKRLSGSHYVSI